MRGEKFKQKSHGEFFANEVIQLEVVKPKKHKYACLDSDHTHVRYIDAETCRVLQTALITAKLELEQYRLFGTVLEVGVMYRDYTALQRDYKSLVEYKSPLDGGKE